MVALSTAARGQAGRRLIRYLQGLLREPLALFVLTMLVVHLVMPLIQLFQDYYRYGLEYSARAHIVAGLWALLYLASATFGYFALVSVANQRKGCQRIVLRHGGLVLSRTEIRLARRLIVIGLILPGSIAAILVAREILSLGVEGYFSDRIAHSSEIGYPVQISRLLYIGIVAWISLRIAQVSAGERVLSPLLIAASVLVSAFFLLTGNRNSILIALVVAGVLWSSQSHGVVKIRLRAILAVVAILVGLAAFGTVRVQLVGGQTESPLAQESLISGANGAFGNHENLLWLAETQTRTELNGTTIIAGLASFVPRSIWADKPIGAGPVMKNLVAPGSYELGGQGQSSLTTGVVTEAVLNFDSWGPGILGFLHGMLLFSSKLFVRNSRTVFGLTGACLVMASVAVFSVYQEFFGLAARLFVTAGGAFLLAAVGQRLSLDRPRMPVGA